MGKPLRRSKNPLSRGHSQHGATIRLRQTTASVKTHHDALNTVLVVEANELNMMLFNDLLEAHGYEVLHTRDAMDALRLARQHRPNLILIVIPLPVISGLEVT